MGRFQGRRIWALVAIGAVLLFTACAALDLPDSMPPELFIAVRIKPTMSEDGLAMTIPVEVRDFVPMNLADTREVAHLLPPGYRWEFTSGYGEAVPNAGGPSCRVYVLRVPGTRKTAIESRIRAQCSQTMQIPAFKATLECPGMAIVGQRASELDDIFPVPFDSAPPRLGNDNTLLAIGTNYPMPQTIDTAWKFDFVVPALGRGLAARRIITPRLDVFHQRDPGIEMRKLPVYPALFNAHPFRLAHDQYRVYGAQFLRGTEFPDALRATIGEFISDRAKDVFRAKLYMGVDPPKGMPKSDRIDFPGQVQTTTPGAGAAAKPFNIVVHTGVRGDKTIDEDGYTLPTATGVDVLVTSLAVTSYPMLQWTVYKELVRAWRWRQILTAPQGVASQTLLRLNEPLWEYIALKSAEAVLGSGDVAQTVSDLGSTENPDIVEYGFINRQIGDARALALSSERAFRIAEGSAPLGQAGDGFYPALAQVDHNVCELLVRALDGMGKKQLNKEIVKLVAFGFTRPRSVLPLAAALTAIGATIPGAPAVELEPDLVWLSRAVTSPASATADAGLGHLLGSVHGTRMQRALNELVTVQKVSSIAWNRPPTMPADTLFFLLDKDSLTDLSSALSYPKIKFSDAPGRSRRVVAAAADGKANNWSDAWWNTWSARQTPAVTAGDTRAYRWYRGSDTIDTTIIELRKIFENDGAGADPAVLREFQRNTVQLKWTGTLPDKNPGATLLVFRWASANPADGLVWAGPQPVHPLVQRILDALRADRQMLVDLPPQGQSARMIDTFFSKKMKTLFSKPEMLLREVYSQFLLGEGGPDEIPPGAFAELLATLTAVARATRTEVTLQ